MVKILVIASEAKQSRGGLPPLCIVAPIDDILLAAA